MGVASGDAGTSLVRERLQLQRAPAPGGIDARCRNTSRESASGMARSGTSTGVDVSGDMP